MSNTLSTFRVLSTYPQHDSKNVPLLTVIQIMFNTDVDVNTIGNGITVIAQDEDIPVKGSLSYDSNRTVSFKPTIPFKPDRIYNVLVKGSIKNILGVECRSHNFVFRTKTEAELYIPSLLFPSEGSMIKSAPSFKWQGVENAVGYEIEASISEDFATKAWNSIVNSVDSEELSITPDKAFRENTIYFWRVRAFAEKKDSPELEYQYGAWSAPYRFIISDDKSSVIANEDEPYIDPAEQEEQQLVIETKTFPEKGFSNVSTNLKTISIHFDGIIDPFSIDPRRWTVEGDHITEDINIDDYGVTDSISKSNHRLADGTWFLSVDEERQESVIIFQPDKL